VPLGARVPTRNPTLWGFDDSLPDPEQATWAKISFSGKKVTGVILEPCIWPHPSTEPFADAPATAGANIKRDGNGSERLKLTSTDTYDSRRLEWFTGKKGDGVRRDKLVLDRE